MPETLETMPETPFSGKSGGGTFSRARQTALFKRANGL